MPASGCRVPGVAMVWESPSPYACYLTAVAGGGSVSVTGPTFDLVVAANRLPVDRVVDDLGTSRWQRSPGGLVTAMEPVMRGRVAAWVGWAGGPGPAPEPFREKGVYLHPVGLSPTEIQEYYEGFSNDTLWPIFHDVIVPATFH